jgi:parallel beta-helix repeat protein
MQLARDQIADLGHVADGAAGVTFRAAAPGSRVADSLITGGFAGVVASDSADVRIVRNRIESTTSDAIDVGSSSHDVTVAGNTIDRVGDHGVLVSGTSRGVVVARNQIRNSRRYAIELFNHVSANRVSDNAITRCFDGIVVTAASRNLLTGNVVTRVRRYGFRVSTGAQANLLRGNVVTSSPVGIYVYGHAYGEQLLANRFRFDQLDIRVKEHAGHNIIRPLPAAVLVGR